MVWLYPDPSGDTQSAFLVADGECKRIETQALDRKSKALSNEMFYFHFFFLNISNLSFFFSNTTLLSSSFYRLFQPIFLWFCCSFQAACVAVYRIAEPSEGTEVLNHFHHPGTISHAVMGGHGSDSAMSLGFCFTLFISFYFSF